MLHACTDAIEEIGYVASEAEEEMDMARFLRTCREVRAKYPDPLAYEFLTVMMENCIDE